MNFPIIINIGYSTRARQFSDLLTEGEAQGQLATELSRSSTITDL